MKTHKPFSVVFGWGIVPAFLLAAVSVTQASTIWNGPSIGFYHTQENLLADQLTSGVSLTRGASGGLYNAVTEAGAVSGISPKDTQWAIGTLANFNTLTYGPCPLEAGGHPPGYVGTTFVVHLINEDIYLQLTLTNWGGAFGVGDKTFGYTRSTPAVTPPTPTVAITNPPNGAVFAAPANVNIGASATVSSGTVTNVQFFTNNVLVGSVPTAPFTLTANNLAAGTYALKAVATAAGVSATSTVVNITVVAAPTVTLTNPANGAVFAAPANINLAADASASGGTVTNVAFFANATALGSVTAAPFTLTSGPLAAGPYALAAVATAAGISTTSAVVNVTVINPTAVNLSGANLNGGQFAFSYTADAGLTYVVQSSSNLVDWVSVATNAASGSPVPFSDSFDSTTIKFYRVSRLLNP